MTTPADLEVSLRRQRDGSYTADLRLQMPEDPHLVLKPLLRLRSVIDLENPAVKTQMHRGA